MSKPVCDTCNDTHRMEVHDEHGDSRVYPCTHCPAPCERCRKGAYCETTPCTCDCHKDSKEQNDATGRGKAPAQSRPGTSSRNPIKCTEYPDSIVFLEDDCLAMEESELAMGVRLTPETRLQLIHALGGVEAPTEEELVRARIAAEHAMVSERTSFAKLNEQAAKFNAHLRSLLAKLEAKRWVESWIS